MSVQSIDSNPSNNAKIDQSLLDDRAAYTSGMSGLNTIQQVIGFEQNNVESEYAVEMICRNE